MEQERINIAELLKDCPKGIKLYSPICGECEFIRVKDSYIQVMPFYTDRLAFDKFGRLYGLGKHGECLLFPSKEERDWRHFNKGEKLLNYIKKKITNIKSILNGSSECCLKSVYQDNQILIQRDKIADILIDELTKCELALKRYEK